jgi:hypothetical protein
VKTIVVPSGDQSGISPSKSSTFRFEPSSRMVTTACTEQNVGAQASSSITRRSPVGAHDGHSGSRVPEMRRRSPPVASVVQVRSFEDEDAKHGAKAMRDPSGDHAGKSPTGGSSVRPLPSGLMVAGWWVPTSTKTIFPFFPGIVAEAHGAVTARVIAASTVAAAPARVMVLPLGRLEPIVPAAPSSVKVLRARKRVPSFPYAQVR